MNLEGEQGKMEELLTEVLKSIRTNRTAPEQVDLPLFRPDVDDAKQWTEQVDAIKTEFEWSDLQTVVRVGRFLTNDAKAWFENWSPIVRDWATFKREFLESFPPKKILGRLLYEASVFNSSSCNTYAVYIHKKIALLKNLRANWSTPDLIELIIYGIHDSKVQESVSMRNFGTISDLIAYLSSTTKSTHVDVSVNNSEPKRPRLERPGTSRTNFSCFKCGRIGHVQRNCNLGNQFKRHATNRFSNFNNNDASHSSQLTNDKCTFCFKTGHVEGKCFVKNAIEQRRKVNFACTDKAAVPTPIKIDKQTYMGLIDTGADVSLISDKFQERFSTKLEAHDLFITGITPGNILSKYKFQADVEITGQHTKLTFVVIPALHLDYDVIIGSNLFTDTNLAAVTDCDGTRIIGRRLPRILRALTDSTNLTVPDEYSAQISHLLGKFAGMVTSGTAVSEVTTASMEINLIDNFIVTRRPYRLSITERAEVRKIVADLLSNNIIRESTSPYASPVLLVKKKRVHIVYVLIFAS